MTILVATSMAMEKHLARRMIGMINVGAHVAIGLSLKQKRTRFINRKKPKKCCANCSHVGAETTSDVACCNCCEDMEFYDELPVELCIEFED